MSAYDVFSVSPRGYSQTVALDLALVSRLVYVSGQVALDASGAVIGSDFETQCRQVFAQLGERLEQAGAGFADVVKLTIFVRDFAHYGTLARVRQELFPAEAPPASTAVAVLELVDPRLLIEVEAVAAVPHTR